MSFDDKPIGLFDLDGSLAQYEQAMRRALDDIRTPGDAPLGPSLWDDEKKYPYLTRRMELIARVPGFWRNLEPDPAGMQVYLTAREMGFRCVVATKGPGGKSAAWGEKHEWCLRHLPDAEPNVVTDKGLLYGRFLYDDYPPYMERWLAHRPRGLGIMPVAPYNASWTHPRVIKYDGTNIVAVRQALLLCYRRESIDMWDLPKQEEPCTQN